MPEGVDGVALGLILLAEQNARLQAALEQERTVVPAYPSETSGKHRR